MFSTSGSTVTRNDASTYSDSCVLGGHFSIAARNGSWNNVHTSDPSSRGQKMGGESSTLVQRAQHIGESSDG
jgi:hypothetical protein